MLQVQPGDLLIIHHQNGVFPGQLHLPDRQVLKNSLLDFAKPIMVRVQDFFRTLDVEIILGVSVPGQGGHIVDMVEPYGVLCRSRVYFFKPVHLFEQDLFNLGRNSLVQHGLAQRGNFFCPCINNLGLFLFFKNPFHPKLLSPKLKNI